MDKVKLQSYRDWVQNELDVCANFWLKNGIDREHFTHMLWIDIVVLSAEVIPRRVRRRLREAIRNPP